MKVSHELLARALDGNTPPFGHLAVQRYANAAAELAAISEQEWATPANEREATEARLIELRRERTEALDEALAAIGQGRPRASAPPRERPGELLLLYQPVEDGWLGFASLDGAVVVHPVPPIDVASRFGSQDANPQDANPQEAGLVHPWLTPFASLLRRAESVRLLPHRSLTALDLHLLPFDGEPITLRLPVRYGLDVPPPSGEASPAAEGRPRRAKVVVDPTGNLPEARREGDEVAERLRGRGFGVTRLLRDERCRLAAGVVDAGVIATALARVIYPVPGYSGHALFLIYATFTAHSLGLRLFGALVLLEVLAIKLAWWNDYVTVLGALGLGLGAAAVRGWAVRGPPGS